jgi:hypothetical protein
MSGGTKFKIDFRDRLKKTYIQYEELISETLTVKDFIKNSLKSVYRNFKVDFDFYIEKNILNNEKILIKINDIEIDKSQYDLILKNILKDDELKINIIIDIKKERDIDSYENMTALLIYLNQQLNSLNIISQLSFNVEHMIANGSLRDSSINKNILQQTQYPNIHSLLNSDHNIINIILYDMAFFEDISNESQQIYNLVNLLEVPLDFEVKNSNKIKKFTKLKNTLFLPKNISSIISVEFTEKLNQLLADYFNYEINWYIVKYTLLTEKDKIQNILTELDIRNKSIHLCNFDGTLIF